MARTIKATLTAVTSIWQTGIGLFIGLVITPYIVKYLTPSHYGFWLYLVQFSGLVAIFDIFPSSSLKAQLATHRHVMDINVKRRLVGAHLILALSSWPIYLAVGAACVFFLPNLVNVATQDIVNINFSFICLVVIASFNKVLSTSALVLRGENLDYKSNIVRSTVTIITALNDLVVVMLGYGLPGLAINKVISCLAQGAVQYYLVKKYVDWFGIAKPNMAQVKDMFQMNWWIYISNVSFNLTTGTDLLIIGTILTSIQVTDYSLTGSLSRFSFNLITPVLQSANPGLGELYGTGKTSRLIEVINILELITIFSAVSISVVCLLINNAFMKLWIGEQHYAGHNLNFTITLLAILVALIKTRLNILNSILEVKIIATIYAKMALITLLLSSMLCYYLGMIGVAVGGVVGAAYAFYQYEIALINTIKHSLVQSHVRLYALSIAILFTVYFIPPPFISFGWYASIIISVAIAALTACLLYMLGLNTLQRQQVLSIAQRALSPALAKYDNFMHKNSE